MAQALSGCGMHREVRICESADELSNLHRSSECARMRQGGGVVYSGKSVDLTQVAMGEAEEWRQGGQKRASGGGCAQVTAY